MRNHSGLRARCLVLAGGRCPILRRLLVRAASDVLQDHIPRSRALWLCGSLPQNHANFSCGAVGEIYARACRFEERSTMLFLSLESVVDIVWKSDDW